VKAFFDTSVLVGAFYGDHPRHAACLRLLEDASKKTHSCAAHSVAELYAVMTRLPVRPRITPEQGLLFVENVRDSFRSSPSRRPSSSKPRRKRPGAGWAVGKSTACSPCNVPQRSVPSASTRWSWRGSRGWRPRNFRSGWGRFPSGFVWEKITPLRVLLR
jgi:hypothetical protein